MGPIFLSWREVSLYRTVCDTVAASMMVCWSALHTSRALLIRMVLTRMGVTRMDFTSQRPPPFGQRSRPPPTAPFCCELGGRLLEQRSQPPHGLAPRAARWQRGSAAERLGAAWRGPSSRPDAHRRRDRRLSEPGPSEGPSRDHRRREAGSARSCLMKSAPSTPAPPERPGPSHGPSCPGRPASPIL